MAKQVQAPSATQDKPMTTPVAVVVDKNDKFLRLEDNSEVELVEGKDFEVYVDESDEANAPDPSLSRGNENEDATTANQSQDVQSRAPHLPPGSGDCVDCAGSGLKDEKTMCPACDGTGKQKVA